jgi:hypothetical protein
MNQQDQEAIDGLFRHLYQTAEQSGPPDEAADALIKRYVQQGPPGLLYEMAQTLVAQQYTLNELRAQLASYQRQSGSPAGFGRPRGAGYQGYAQPQYQQPGWQQPGRAGGGFLAGAGQLALGIGGGILGAEVLSNIFSGAGGLFGDRDREYGEGYQDGYAAGDDNRDQGDYQGQDSGDYNDADAYDGGGFDDGGGF